MSNIILNSKTRLILLVTIYLYLIGLAVFYSFRGNGDLAIFLEAGSRYLNGEDPYSGTEMPFVHGPASLPVYAALSLLPGVLSSLLWNLSLVLLTFLLTLLVKKWYQIDILTIVVLLTLTTPYRTILGNGQVGISVLLTVLVLLNIDRIEGRNSRRWIWYIGTCLVLTVKPYLLIGLIIKMILKRDFYSLIKVFLFFVITSLCIPFQNPLFIEYINSLLRRGQGSHMERDNFSLAAAAGNLINLDKFGLLLGLALGLFLILTVVRGERCFPDWLVFLLPVVMSSYVHSQDLIFISLSLILLPRLGGIIPILPKSLKSNRQILLLVFIFFCTSFSSVGLLVQFFLFIAVLKIEALKIFLTPIFFVFVISLIANYFFRSGNLTLAYHFYGIPYQVIISFLPLFLIYSFRSENRRTRAYVVDR